MAHQVHHSRAGDGRELFTVDSTATVKIGAEHTDAQYELFEIDSARGSFVPPHRHPWPESYYVLHGRLSVQVGSKLYDLGPGESITVPTGAVHTIEPASATVKFLAFSLTDGTGRLFNDLDTNIPKGRPIEEIAPLLTEIAERNHTTFIGRPSRLSAERHPVATLSGPATGILLDAVAAPRRSNAFSMIVDRACSSRRAP